MTISKLTLHNFGVYAGTNIFEFHGNKPVVLIGGLNGRGKTTFLEAILLALYGKNSFAFNESSGQSYGQYLRSYVNVADGSFQTFVELEFYMPEAEGEKYRVRREWNALKKRTAEQIIVYKDETFNKFLTDNWTMFMENVLPSGLSNFFFFDGEKIAELAVEKTSKQMKESIKALLGITVLDHLESDLARIISRTAKNRVDDDEVAIIELLRIKKDGAQQELDKSEQELLKLNDELLVIKRKIDKAHEEYIAKGGDIIAQRQELMEMRSLSKAKLESNNDELLTSAASELPLVLVRDMLRNIREKAEIEHDQKVMGSAIDKMYAALGQFKKERAVDAQDVMEFVDYFRKLTSKKVTDATFCLSDTALSQAQQLLDQKLVDRKILTQNIQSRRDALRREVDQFESYLSVDIDEKAINKIYKKIKQLEHEEADLTVKIESKQERHRALKGNAIIAGAEFNKKVEAYLKKVELNDDGDRIIKYANVATAVIERYRRKLQTQKASVVADTMTACYKELANKKNLINNIKMDPETLDLVYLDKDGVEVPKTSLSAGEKQLMVIALLWALAKCSKIKLPVIIDTPLSRLDSVHREALIKVYFPQASDQTIILSTDSEIDGKYYKMMHDNIGDEYTLVYDDISKSTSICKGYFMEALQ